VIARKEIVGEGVPNPVAPFTRAVLGNGTTVIVKTNSRLPVVAMDCWVRTGTVNERAEVNGISHFYEHMFFKGTRKHPAGELDRLVKEMGGYNNAATSNEYTHYYVVLPGGLNERALEMLADAIYNHDFKDEDINRERMVVKEEIHRSEDDPATKLYTTLFETCFEGTPYALPILGRSESLDRIDARAIEEYHRSHYVPENLTVVISGDVEPEGTLEIVARNFGGVEGRPASGWNEIHVKKPAAAREVVIAKDVQQVYLAIGFVTGGFLHDRETIVALDLVGSVLGEGRSSRLHQELVETKKLAISIGTWNWDMRVAGILWIDAILRPDTIRAAEAAIFEELDKFLQRGPDLSEIMKVKKMIKADHLYDLETNAAIAGMLGFYQTDFGDAAESLTYLRMMEEVGREDMRAAFSGVYDRQRFVKSLVVPNEEQKRWTTAAT
jgi:zinc protease